MTVPASSPCRAFERVIHASAGFVIGHEGGLPFGEIGDLVVGDELHGSLRIVLVVIKRWVVQMFETWSLCVPFPITNPSPCLHGPRPDIPHGEGASRPPRGPNAALMMHAGLHLQVHQQSAWIFQRFLHANEECHRAFAVHDAVVIAQCEIHHRANDDLAVDRHGAVLDFVHAEDA